MIAARSASPDTISIGADHLRRLLFSIITAHQDQLIRKGGLPEAARLSARSPVASAAIDECVIDEADLGFDSLARLDLVAELTERFGLAETGVEDYLLVRRRIADWIELTQWHLAQRGPDAIFGFASSGSTGAPTWTHHRLSDLSSEIAAVLDGPLSGPLPGRILALVPPHHIYGFLWSVLLPAATGLGVCDVPAGLASSTFRQVRPGDLVIATPFGWEALAKSGRTLPTTVTGITSGGPTTGATWSAARRLGLSRLIEIYGATETAGIGWRENGDAPFELAGDIGRDGPHLFRRSRPEAPLEIQDRIEWVSERRFRVLGRRDTVVQVAGVNVNLAELQARFLTVTGVKEVAIRLSGDRLKAFLVGDRATADIGLTELLRSLPAPARPDRITWGAALPRTPEGKLADWD